MRYALAAVLALTVVGTAACSGDDEERDAEPKRTTTTARRDCTPGTHEFRLENGRRALMRVGQPGKRPYALIVALHGAGGTPTGAVEAFFGGWDVPGIVFVAPAAKGQTWSAVYSDQDLDLESVDLAVAEAWGRCDLDHDRLALGGFSDGATYALTLGVANGDLFPSIIALSPGGILADTRRGRPRIFVSHGTGDSVLPITGASDTIVPILQSAGYDVTYRKFDGDHEVPPDVSAAAVRWFLDGLG